MGVEESFSVPATAKDHPVLDPQEPAKPRPAASGGFIANPESAKPRSENVERNPWQDSKQAKEIIESLEGKDREISIAMNPDTHQVVVEVTDARTGELIRKLPLNESGTAADHLKGLIVDAAE